MISGENLSLKRSSEKYVLKGVSFNCLPGRVTAFIGKSGAGKTTALRCIAGLESDFLGRLSCKAVDIKSLSPKDRAKIVGYVAQNYNLFPNLSAVENCALALETVLKQRKDAAYEKACATLARVGMADYINAYPRELSGGQKQRVAIARALCLEPEALLLDEPTSALDPENVTVIAALIKELIAQKITVVLSSQDMRFVNLVYDDIYLFREGEMVERGYREHIGESIERFLSM